MSHWDICRGVRGTLETLRPKEQRAFGRKRSVWLGKRWNSSAYSSIIRALHQRTDSSLDDLPHGGSVSLEGGKRSQYRVFLSQLEMRQKGERLASVPLRTDQSGCRREAKERRRRKERMQKKGEGKGRGRGSGVSDMQERRNTITHPVATPPGWVV
jgi:hypothetical protein